MPSSYPRTLSTKELAAALSPPRKMRVVQKWADEGAPHTAAKGRGGKRLLWNLEEVQHWLEAQGRKADRTEKLFVLSAPATSGAAATPAPFPGTMVVNTAEILGQMNRLLNDVLSIRPDGMTVTNLQQWSTAIKNVSHELRQLRDEVAAIDEREHRVIPRERAEAWLAGLAGLFRGALESWVTRLPAEISLACDDALRPLAETLRPVIAAATRREADRQLAALAQRLDHTASELAALGAHNLQPTPTPPTPTTPPLTEARA